MAMADAVGIATVPHALIQIGKVYAYITKRIDRVFYNDHVEKLALEDFALVMNCKKMNIRRNDFFLFAENIGITKKAAQKMINQLVSQKDMHKSMCTESYLPDHMKTSFLELIEKRCSVLMS